MCDIFLDTFVFELQPFGGISSIWEQILEGAACASDLKVAYLHSKSEKKRVDSLVGLSADKFNDKGSIFFRRFVKPTLPERTKVFHSSYFRLASSNQIRNIITVHDCIEEKFGHGLRSLAHLRVKTRGIRAAHKIICVSNHTKQDLLSFYPWLDPASVIVIHNGIDLSFFTPDSIEHTNSLLFVGARRKYKNFDLVLKLLSSEYASRINLRLNVVGGGLPTYDERRRINDLGIGDRIKFLGPLDRVTLRDVYRKSYALIYPSLYEGFGIPPIEAMACGCPVLCSSRSSLPEVVGEAALMFDPCDLAAALRELIKLENWKIRSQLQTSGIYQSAKFPSGAMVKKTLDVYREAL